MYKKINKSINNFSWPANELGVEGEDRLLVASDEECWRHVLKFNFSQCFRNIQHSCCHLGHDVQPGGVQGGAGGASLGQRQRHHHQLRGAGVGAKHLSQTQMSANIAY